jgi:hypothetical protein
MIDEIITQLASLVSAGTIKTAAHAFTSTPTDLNEDADSLPAVYLYPGSDAPLGPDADYCEDLFIAEAVHVLYVCAPSDLTTVKQAVRHSLIGFQPTTQDRPLAFQVGDVVPDGVRGSLIWWRDIFSTEYLQTSAAT